MTTWPALSSDARLIAYVSDAGQDGTTPQIWIQQIGGTALRLTNGEHARTRISRSRRTTLGSCLRRATIPARTSTRFRRSEENRACSSAARAAARCRPMANGSRLFRAMRPASASPRAAAPVFAPSRLNCSMSACAAVEARQPFAWLCMRVPIRRSRPDWWIVPIDGGSPTKTGWFSGSARQDLFTVPTGVAWVGDSLVVSAAGATGSVSIGSASRARRSSPRARRSA